MIIKSRKEPKVKPFTPYEPELFKPSEMLNANGEYDASYDPSWEEIWPAVRRKYGFNDEQADYVARLFRYHFNTTDVHGGVLPPSQRLKDY